MKQVVAAVIFLSCFPLWAQPKFGDLSAFDHMQLPGVLYMENDQNTGIMRLKISLRGLGVWESFEVASAPYLNVYYSGKGGAMLSGGASVDECYLYGMDLRNGRRQEIIGSPVHDPLLGKEEMGWLRKEPISNAIFLAYLLNENESMTLVHYDYNTNNATKTELNPSLFFDGITAQLRIKIAPDGKHVAYLSNPKPVSGTADMYESTLKVIHFSNMSVTNATTSVVTRVKGGAEKAWAPFDFQDVTNIHYLSAGIAENAGTAQSVFIYKNVEVEQGTNSEFFSTILPVPESAGSLNRDPENYQMFYRHDAAPATRYFADFNSTRSLLVYPPQNSFSAKVDGTTFTVKAGRKTLYSLVNTSTQLISGVKSYYDQYAFSLGLGDGASGESQVYFFDPFGNLWPVLWNPNPVKVLGVIEVSDPLKIRP